MRNLESEMIAKLLEGEVYVYQGVLYVVKGVNGSARYSVR
jgi:hypothetical protein